MQVINSDCIEAMKAMADNSVDSIVTDPPYELGFMGKSWDSSGVAFNVEVWQEALRVLKPGGHLIAFSGSRTYHRMAVAIEDAGFEIRDQIMWVYGSGFPKSMDISKAIDKASGFVGDVIGTEKVDIGMQGGSMHAGRSRNVIEREITAISGEAKQWQGWGTALKPAHEPIVVARKPLIGTVAENVLTHGTGALNIDGCRIGTEQTTTTIKDLSQAHGNKFGVGGIEYPKMGEKLNPPGRWPANVILDESQAAALDKQRGVTDSALRTGQRTGKDLGTYGRFEGQSDVVMGHNDTGGASRFFYVAKASKKERPNVNGVAHPTVKPMALMQYLVRLVTPPNGTVLEPFAGSGTTIEAALNEGFNVIGIEMTDEYLPLIMSRIERYGDKLC
jgi:site-specific DNA-methyltransferase (adenine-specific)